MGQGQTTILNKTKDMETNLQEIPNKENQKVKSRTGLLLLSAFIIIVGFFFFSHLGHLINGLPHKGHVGDPEENTFYLATKGTTPVLFYRYPDLIIDHNTPTHSIGHFAAYQTSYNPKKNPLDFVDFNKLQNKKKLFSFEGHVGIENYLLSEDKKYLLISFLGGKADTTNYIYQIDLQTMKSQKIWEHELRLGTPPYNGGIAHVTNFIPNRYVAFSIIKDAPYPTALPVGVIIKNIQSGQEKILGVVGGIQIDVARGTISFKKLGKIQVPCEQHDPVCFATDIYKFAYKPEGEPLKQPLP
jgi:hypothetical protein